MMTEDARLDHLISRKLDGELTAEESLELDKILIRDPQARREQDTAERIDALTASLIHEICAGPETPAVQVPGRRLSRRLYWFAFPAAAAAACLLIWTTWSATLNHYGNNETAGLKQSEPEPRLVDWEGRKPYRKRGTALDFYGVYDEKSGKFYMLQVERTQTARGYAGSGHPERGNVRFASDDM